MMLDSDERRAMSGWICVDGNEAAAEIAYKLSEVIAIYPITPASPMGELADGRSSSGHPNLWGLVPQVIEMQSEAGAAGALHGALQKGALATTFTSSQGLLLMLPNMFKIAGELSPAVIHVAARAVATHALSIFGDHSDVMTARTTGFAMLASSSVQEAQDLALIAHLATLRSRVPFLHFFDGFRTSHEVDKIQSISDSDMEDLVDLESVREHRARGLTPDHPVLRGSAQNPDVFFQAREASNPFHAAVPEIVRREMEAFAAKTGRSYHLVDYLGAPDADRVLIIMGSGAGAAAEAVRKLNRGGERVGLINLRLYRPFPAADLIAALPASVRSIAVMDRTKEPGALGEPLYQDVITALAESVSSGNGHFEVMPRVVGGRYGLASKEFTPAMVAGVFGTLSQPRPINHFSVGIVDDVTHKSIAYKPAFDTDSSQLRAMFFGRGSDGTVGAVKSAAKIIGEGTEAFPQGYFVYDSKKSGSLTVSHLRVDPKPIRSTYLISKANFVACHHMELLERMDVLGSAEVGATVLLNSPYLPAEVWNQLSARVQQEILAKNLHLYVINANQIAGELGLRTRINTVMQTAFFKLAGIMPLEQATQAIKASIDKTYGKLGRVIVQKNIAAVDQALTEVHLVEIPAGSAPITAPLTLVPADASDFVGRVTARLLAGEGDLLPVSAMPVDGTFPTGTARLEKRSIAEEIPIWDTDICIDCGQCALVCPHAAIQMKVFEPALLEAAPEGYQAKDFHSAEVSGMKLTIQVAPDDCTGCGVCVDICPAKSKGEVKHKAINMLAAAPHLERERANFDFFLGIPELDRSLMDPASVKGSQVRLPLFEFSGACAGCGETPYLKLLTQLFGDHIVVANATGCSSIYGGNLPTTPWGTNEEGRGPAWSNSLFEDNAEFGLGMELGHDRQRALARVLLERLAGEVGPDLARGLLYAEQSDDVAIAAQRARIVELKQILSELAAAGSDDARDLLQLADELVKKSVWIVGGDGWAYDIGSAGLDHVLSSGRDVNVLVLDTEVYSNTGGQASKSTPRAAVAKFASSGKATSKKDLGMIAAQYGNVYVAQVAMGANYGQTIKAFLEAEAWPGPSLIIAYSTCIAHGIDMTKSMSHQKDAVKSGYWPLYRYKPGVASHQRPFHLDSKTPTIPIREFTRLEGRFAMLERSQPDHADRLLTMAQSDVDERWRLYSQMAGVERTVPAGSEPAESFEADSQ
jgi:pyruvate-ferredoxin/flavodoxin oxidoreductase